MTHLLIDLCYLFITMLDENETGSWGTDEQIDYLDSKISTISQFANTNGMPVLIGEYGAIDKNNLSARASYCYELNYCAGYYGNIVTAYWDNGVIGTNGFALFNRETNTVNSDGVTIISNIINDYADRP